MFSNYQDLSTNYIPNNLTCKFPTRIEQSKLYSQDASKPYEEYNAEGKLIGYYWNQGDILNLEFMIDGEITVETTALILSNVGQTPTKETTGFVGQRCYNIRDLRSWTCRSQLDTQYVWEMDEVFTYPAGADRSVYMDASDYLKDKMALITLYNFRMEPVHEYSVEATPFIVFPIDADLTSKLVKGIYFCSVRIYNSTMSQTVFSSEDCKLLVK